MPYADVYRKPWLPKNRQTGLLRRQRNGLLHLSVAVGGGRVGSLGHAQHAPDIAERPTIDILPYDAKQKGWLPHRKHMLLSCRAVFLFLRPGGDEEDIARKQEVGVLALLAQSGVAGM